MMLLPDYQKSVESCFNKFIPITLTVDREQKVAVFLKKTLDAFLKKNEMSKLENVEPWQKMKMILSGEAALEQFLNFEFISWSNNIYGQYDSSSLNDARIKVKVFKRGEFPIVYKNNTKNLVFIMQQDIRTFYICGVADRLLLNSYHNENLLPASELKKNNKSCYYGFNELRQFTNKEELFTAFHR